jgi:hypothetical protein
MDDSPAVFLAALILSHPGSRGSIPTDSNPPAPLNTVLGFAILLFQAEKRIEVI